MSCRGWGGEREADSDDTLVGRSEESRLDRGREEDISCNGSDHSHHSHHDREGILLNESLDHDFDPEARESLEGLSMIDVLLSNM